MVQDPPDPQLVAQIASLTYADPRSVRKELAGKRVVGRVGERIRVALAALVHQRVAAEASGDAKR